MLCSVAIGVVSDETVYAASRNRNDTMIRRWKVTMRQRGDQLRRDKTDLSPVYLALGSEETIMTSPHLGEGIRDKLRLWKVISVAEDVRKSGWIGSKQSGAVDKTTVGKGVAILLCPGMNNIAVLLVS